MKQYFSIFFLLVSFVSFGQYEDIIPENYVYTTNIKSVEFRTSSNPLSTPVVFLNGGERLILEFDDLDNEVKDFSYEIVHCSREWQPSNLQPIEYLTGLQNEEITRFYPSQNTFVPYIHYQLSLPNRDIRFNLSGNYLLIVYDGKEVSDRFPVITRRFMVVDQSVVVEVKNKRPMQVANLTTQESFDIKVNTEDFRVIQPLNSISMTVVQNGRWDHAITNLAPKFTVGEKLIFDNMDLISFDAGKEFRNVDIRSLDFTAIGINEIELTPVGTIVKTDVHIPMRETSYITNIDANGMFVIGNRDIISGAGTAGANEDYANVVFRLEMDETNEDIYVTGGFTDWKPDEMYQMYYDEIEGMYKLELLLKQGFYDFMYGVADGDKVDTKAIEGTWHETDNFYEVFIYMHQPTDRYDRLVGYTKFNSFQGF